MRIKPIILKRTAVAVNLLLLSLIAYSLSDFTWSSVTPQKIQTYPSTIRPLKPIHQDPVGHYRISHLHLFGEAEPQIIIDPVTVSGGGKPYVPPQLTLTGIIHHDSPTLARAILKGDSLEETALKPGAKIETMVLESIHQEHVVFKTVDNNQLVLQLHSRS